MSESPVRFQFQLLQILAGTTLAAAACAAMAATPWPLPAKIVLGAILVAWSVYFVVRFPWLLRRILERRETLRQQRAGLESDIARRRRR